MNQQDPQVLYALGNLGGDGQEGSGPARLLKTVDGGDHWQPTGFELSQDSARSPVQMVISPIDPQLLYLVVARGSAGGVYRSQDGGEHWERTAWPETAAYPSQSIADSVDGDVAYAYKALDRWIFRTADRGVIWAPAHEVPLRGDLEALAIATQPSGGSRLYAIVYDGEGQRPVLTWSDDEGKTWSP